VHDLISGVLDFKTIKTMLTVIGKSPQVKPEKLALVAHELPKALKALVKAIPSFKIKNAYLLSSKVGPNGRYAALHSHQDYIALVEENLLPKVTRLGQAVAAAAFGCAIRQSWPDWHDVIMDSLSDSERQELRSGKLAFLPEKAGKVRIIAIGDSFSQNVLKPIHDSLMHILERIPEDCTFNQEKGAEFLSRVTSDSDFVASFDHSSCTDLFPARIQADVLNHLYGDEVGEAWLELVSTREFSYRIKDSNEVVEGKVSWSVGQPMGLYASWPIMALSHHALVYIASSICKVTPTGRYCILGDDIVIAHQLLAETYLKLVESLGMKINLQKSFISESGTPSCGEFAKRQFTDGGEITPLPTALVQSALNDWRLAPLLITKVRDRISFPLNDCVRWIKVTFPEQVSNLMKLLHLPIWMGGFGYPAERPLRELLLGDDPDKVPPFCWWLQMAINEMQRDNDVTMSTLSDAFEKVADTVPMSVYREHPFVHQMISNQSLDRGSPYRTTFQIPPTGGGLLFPVEWVSEAVAFYKKLLTQRSLSRVEQRFNLSIQKKRQISNVNRWLRVLTRRSLRNSSSPPKGINRNIDDLIEEVEALTQNRSSERVPSFRNPGLEMAIDLAAQDLSEYHLSTR
jgi:hypothetical protein